MKERVFISLILVLIIINFVSSETFQGCHDTDFRFAMNFDQEDIFQFDTSGNNNEIIVNGATYIMNGKFAGAYNFDGINDEIIVTDSPSLSITSSITMSAWVYPRSSSGWKTIFCKQANPTYTPPYCDYGFGLSDIDPNKYHIIINDYRGDFGNVQYNTWNHVACSYRNRYEITCYVNGVKEVLPPTAVTAPLDSAYPLRIGASQDGDYYDGMIDDISIWHKDLSEQQILDIYNSGAPLDCGYYNAFKTRLPLTIDGNINEFLNANEITLTNSDGTEGKYKFLWDNSALYIAADVSDTKLNVDPLNQEDGSLWNDDSIEMFFDTLNDKSATIQNDDYKFFVNVDSIHADSQSFNMGWNSGITYAVSYSQSINNNVDTDTGYVMEIKIPWSGWVSSPDPNDIFGLDLSMNDRNETGDTIQELWLNSDGLSSNEPSGWGDIIFQRVPSLCGPADINPRDGVVSILELISYISDWKTGLVDILDLITGISEWKAGCS